MSSIKSTPLEQRFSFGVCSPSACRGRIGPTMELIFHLNYSNERRSMLDGLSLQLSSWLSHELDQQLSLTAQGVADETSMLRFGERPLGQHRIGRFGNSQRYARNDTSELRDAFDTPERRLDNALHAIPFQLRCTSH